jgi:hypothetical protein
MRPFAIGNGLDIGRDVFGIRWESSWEGGVDNLFDMRNVHAVDGKYIETVTRDVRTWKVNDRLIAKALGIHHDLPKTKGGVDPFLYDSRSGEFLTDWSSVPVADGNDPSLKTGSVGLEYALTKWASVNGIYEYTNDCTLAYDNFPRGNLNSAQPSYQYTEYGNTYVRDRNFLYDQQIFPQPPYEFYHVFKAGLRLNPNPQWEVYADFTRNEFESAGQISDAMNHIGLEIGYLPVPKLGLYLRYTYSRWQDLDRLLQGITEPAGHHNVFGSLRYLPGINDEFVFEYGVSPNYPLTEMAGNDPFGGSLLTIDTQHIVRLYYRKRF